MASNGAPFRVTRSGTAAGTRAWAIPSSENANSAAHNAGLHVLDIVKNPLLSSGSKDCIGTAAVADEHVPKRDASRGHG